MVIIDVLGREIEEGGEGGVDGDDCVPPSWLLTLATHCSAEWGDACCADFASYAAHSLRPYPVVLSLAAAP